MVALKKDRTEVREKGGGGWLGEVQQAVQSYKEWRMDLEPSPSDWQTSVGIIGGRRTEVLLGGIEWVEGEGLLCLLKFKLGWAVLRRLLRQRQWAHGVERTRASPVFLISR